MNMCGLRRVSDLLGLRVCLSTFCQGVCRGAGSPVQPEKERRAGHAAYFLIIEDDTSDHFDCSPLPSQLYPQSVSFPGHG
ncbi:hypothetical protein GE09DRAFT_1124446 [Coniochaeta sp. 2T2.1]|nr:hypothetical protein GE09DRAFT_1124446 [Coniochaeta sp. 2T2.1]